MSEDGKKEERCWKDGLLEGPASVEGVNGDRLEFTYKAGVRMTNTNTTMLARKMAPGDHNDAV